MEFSIIELDPLTKEHEPPQPSHHRFGWIVVATALIATGALAVSVLRSADREELSVQAEATPTANALPPPSPTVVQPATPRRSQFAAAYEGCMADVGGSADSRERWVDICRREADKVLDDERLYAACMRNLGGSPDSQERHADKCRRQIEAATP